MKKRQFKKLMKEMNYLGDDISFNDHRVSDVQNKVNNILEVLQKMAEDKENVRNVSVV